MKEKKRLVLISISIFFLFSLLIVQFFKIQILEGEKWSQIALSQHEIIVKEPFRRGAFYSNTTLKKGHPEKPQPLVFDVTKYHLYVDPVSIPEKRRGEVAERIAHFTSESMEQCLSELGRKSRSRKVAPWLDLERKEAIIKWWSSYAKKNRIPRNALYFVTDYKRSYPFGKLLGQVLHTIRDVKDETTHEGVPTGGLEAYFNDYLHGKMGKRKWLRSPLNSLETETLIESPENGADIYLTINHCIQAIAEEEIEKGVKATGAKGGWAVMMEPHTGEILALAQYPFFEPERYREFFNEEEKRERAKVKPISDAFELGSIMKPITAAICLYANEELVKKGSPPFFDPCGKIDTTRTLFPGRGGKPLHDTSFHKVLNMDMALQKSSNIYFAQLMEQVINLFGNHWYRKALVDLFGFSTLTGIELPSESPGLVPTPGKKHPNGALEWSTPTPYSLAMGHNMLATSLQMLRAYALFANGGVLVEPTLIRKIVRVDEKGEEQILVDHTSLERLEAFPRVLSSGIIGQVVRGMKFSTKPGGTGHLAAINGYSEAGKTGTSEKIVHGVYSKEEYISSFIGFAPATSEAGRFELIVSIDEPEPIRLKDGGKNYHGGRAAAPVFREIARRTLEYLGVDPDDPYGYTPGDPRYNAEKADWVQEVRELKLLYEQWNKPT